MLEELISQCKGNSLSILAILLKLSSPKEPPITRKITLSSPSLECDHILSLIRYQLEVFSFKGGITNVRIEIPATSLIISNVAADFFDNSYNASQNKDESILLDTLLQTSAPNSLFKVATHTSHIPERAFSYESISPNFFSEHSPNHLLSLKRPSVIFELPQKIAAISLLPDHPPHAVTWDDKTYKVVTGLGPERIAPEWWKTCADNPRDYFCLQLESGTWVWAFRNTTSSDWFIHGIWA